MFRRNFYLTVGIDYNQFSKNMAIIPDIEVPIIKTKYHLIIMELDRS